MDSGWLKVVAGNDPWLRPQKQAGDALGCAPPYERLPTRHAGCADVVMNKRERLY